MKNGSLAPRICLDDLINRDTYVSTKSNADVLSATEVTGSSGIWAGEVIIKIDDSLDLYMSYKNYAYYIVLAKHDEDGIRYGNTVVISSAYMSRYEVYTDLPESRIVIASIVDSKYLYAWLFSFSGTPALKLVANTLLDSVTKSNHRLDLGNITKSNGLYVVTSTQTEQETYGTNTNVRIRSLRASDTNMSLVDTWSRGYSLSDSSDTESVYAISVGSYLYVMLTKKLTSYTQNSYLYKFEVQVSTITEKSSLLLGDQGKFTNVLYSINEDQSRLLLVMARKYTYSEVPKVDLQYFNIGGEVPISLDWKTINLSAKFLTGITEIILTKHDISTFVLSTASHVNPSSVTLACVTGVFRTMDNSIVLGSFIDASLSDTYVSNEVSRGVHRVSGAKYTALIYANSRLNTYSFELEDLTLVNTTLRVDLTNSYGEVLGDVAGLVSDKVILLIPQTSTLGRFNTLDMATCSVIDSDIFSNVSVTFLRTYRGENGWILMRPNVAKSVIVYIKVKIYPDGTILKYITEATAVIDGITKDKTVKGAINKVWLLNK